MLITFYPVHKTNSIFALAKLEHHFSIKVINIYCGVEQLVARWAHNPKVIGSSPVPATKEDGN
jgi:hypothetical protein